MTTEFDLRCATCGGSLEETTVSPDAVRPDVGSPIAVAECADCGGRYFPEQVLDRLGRRGR